MKASNQWTESIKAVQDEGCVRSTYQRLCVLGPTLYLSRRTLGRGLLSLCRGYTSESWSSPFYVSSGSRLSSPHIHLEDQEKWFSLINKALKVAGWQISVQTDVTFDLLFILFYILATPSILTQMDTCDQLQFPAAKIFFRCFIWTERSSEMPQCMMFTVFDFKRRESKLQILPISTTRAAIVQYLSCHSCGKHSW